jgi:riboflavin biosynthesis pyrimidine reductase
MHMLLPDRVASLSPAGMADAFTFPVTDRPWVRAVMVSTADGAAKSREGLSGGISSTSDKLFFNAQRGLADVVLVGAETVRKEGYKAVTPRQPWQKLRADRGLSPVHRLAIITGSGTIDETGELFTESAEAPILIVPASLPDERRTALEPVAHLVTAGQTRVDLGAAVTALGAMGLTRVAMEGGPRLLAQMAAAGLMDEYCITITPLLAGGSYGGASVPRILDGVPLPGAPQALRLTLVLEEAGTLVMLYTRTD